MDGAVTIADGTNIDVTEGGAINAYVTASGFNGNLTTTDDTVQEVAQKFDDYVPDQIIGWVIKPSDTATAVADGKDAIVASAGMNGMNLVDVSCRVSAPNGATSGSTTVVLRRVRTGARMGDDTSQFDLTFSTPTVTVTWDSTGTDPGISTSTLAAGDEVDLSGFATAANNGHFTIASVGANYITFSNASGVENLNDTGVTIIPTRHRDMTSTGVTVAYNEYTASDETVDTSNDDVTTGDSIYADVTAITSGAAQKGLSCTATLQTP